MLNQERVCEMTRLAMFDQTEGQKCKPMAQYFRKDYIAGELLKSLVTGTAAFVLVLALWGVYGADSLINRLNAMSIRRVIVDLFLCYAVFMAVYQGITYMIYYARYSRGRQKIKKYYIHLKRVNKLYRQEEQL